MSDSSVGRRDFLLTGGALAAGFLARGAAPAEARVKPTAATPLPDNPMTDRVMPTRNLGRTGYRTGIFSLGGQATIEQPDMEAEAMAIVNRAIDLGVNYIDTAAAYGGERRWSQRYIGQVTKHRRKEVFLASKTHLRTRDESLKLLEESLKLLHTDHLDLWQVHNLSRMEQVDQIFAKGGAIEALLQAREQGLVRYLGVTGHADPDVLIAAIERFPFDTVLMALNAADRHQLSFTAKLLPLAMEKQMGIIGMKIPARSRILASWTPPPATQQPAFGQASRPGTLTMKEALYYVLSQPVSTVIIGCDTIAQLEENVRLAAEFTPLTDTSLGVLAEKTESIARQALFFRRWG